MPKLKKTKSYTVSKLTKTIEIEGRIYEIANLEKSGITNQTIVLIDINDIWEEINILNIGCDNSNLSGFVNFVQDHDLNLSDLGFEEPKKQYVSVQIGHDDFMQLQEQFPEFNYIDISLLNDHLIGKYIKTSQWELRGWLTRIKTDKLTIKQFLEKINMSKTTQPPKQVDLVESIKEVEAEFDSANNEASNEGRIDKLNPMIIENNIEVSIEVFSSLTPEKISEFKGIKESQDLVILENPFVKVTDKATLETAKKSRAALLKASTSTEAVETNATKYLNLFKNTIKTAIAGLAKQTRDAYNSQDTEIKAFENAEAIRIATEERLKLEKIKKRTDLLFGIPMTFNGTIYSIGTLYVLPSQIEGLEDIEFNKLIEQGKSIFTQIEADKNKESEKDKEIAELKAMLAKLMPKTEEDIHITNSVLIASAEPVKNEVKSEPAVNITVNQPMMPSNNSISAKKIFDYEIPTPENKLLNELDLQNTAHLENQAFLKCRSYYVRGILDLSNEIRKILNSETKTKGKEIGELLDIMEKSK